jgi:hypothetical protein
MLFSMDYNFKDKFPQAKSFEDFRREISIIEIASAHGYILEYKKGLRTPVLYNPEYQDRIIILDPKNPANQGYWNPEDETDKGTLIHFVKKRLGTLFPHLHKNSDNANVNSVLYQYLRLDPFVRQQNRQLINYEALEQLEATGFLPASYHLKPLVQTGFFRHRYIALETLKRPEFAGRIFNVQYVDPHKPGLKYTNTAFPYFVSAHEKMVGLEIRNIHFKSHAEGSDRSNGVWYSNMPALLERIVLVESALDALSHLELKQQTNNLYVSYGGNLTLNQIQTIKELKKKGYLARNFQFVTASDNDRKGAYYDLMFIRDLAAGRYPSQRLAKSGHSIKLAFSPGSSQNPAGPTPAGLLDFADRLTEKLRPYQDQLDREIIKDDSSGQLATDGEKGKIKLQVAGGQLLVEVPKNFLALHTFNEKFILAAGLEHEVRIDKAFLNDYNEDLKLIKLINQDAALLAEFNKKDLKRKPEHPLKYLDLKFVLLQPGRYAQVGKVFQLVKNQEEGNPVLKFGSPAAGGGETKELPPKRSQKRKGPHPKG